ncbi:hypothetical protein ACM01_17730 [Streptomyces viridochromogenes]|uniref:CopG family transcriptional regulator n=1 Tax=Streptomyces viridochromogenes TaxID=1938 RepID=A0A0J7ZDZ2_STRVR|nr:hypothetical protein [Streptomyces viridochromogenes]KMS73587.1 hypothetical protein ACM01_17730 [Streptomyces viridochromogenes]KOG07907.1 hypothetical protein ADK36_44135 [Streptomyces viridochromogenes]KOG28335.1 hypothetical protein ADK35_03720 [Streptomyces viridochromogenes]
MTVEHAPPDDTTVKKSVTVPESLAREVEARTGARGFSRFVSDTVEHALALTRTREIVEAYEDEHGSFTPEEIEEARRAWHGK